MAQRLTTSFVNTNRPGAYFDQKVKSNPVGVASSGNIIIMGEADGGAANQGVDSNGDILKDNFYTPDQIDRVISKYTRGPIVDAFRALSSPSADVGITGSANRIYIAKTNKSDKASATVASAYGTIQDRNYGLDGNKYNYQISESASEVAPEITGSIIAGFGAVLDSASFTIRVSGGVEAVITLGTGTHANIGDLVTEIDGLLPANMSAEAGTAADSLKIKHDEDTTAASKGYGKSFELIDSTPGDLALIGHAEGLTVSSQEPEVQIDINRTDTNTNEQFIASAEIALEIGYEGTTATCTITDSTLTTVVTGGAGAALSIDLTQLTTIAELADFISSQTGYTAISAATSTQRSPVQLDDVTAVDICSTESGILPGRIKRAAASFFVATNQSAVLEFIATSAEGLPDDMANAAFLANGAKGATTGANIIAAIDDAETIDVNFVVPLFSQNASDDIADGETDSGSTYTIAAINAATKNHVLKMSTAKIKKHRTAFCSLWASFSEDQSQAGSLAHYRVSVAIQRSSQVDENGEIVSFMPWHTAVIAAGMQAGGFYKSITNKFANVISFTDPEGFDSGSPGDIETAIDSGLLFLEKAVVGSKWVVDQTTYGVDTNFVFNSIQAVYAMDLVSLDLASSLQTAFVGQSVADIDAATAISFIASKMDAFKKQKLIAASDDAPLGFKNASVELIAPVMTVRVEIKLSTAILFIPINLEFSQVKSVA